MTAEQLALVNDSKNKQSRPLRTGFGSKWRGQDLNL